ncbi:hypothetical protein [Pseudohongiella spirulinae]|nr:hypothetical protein [Pseudohongiella spirulinae]
MTFSRGGIFATVGILIIQLIATGLIARIKVLVMSITLTLFMIGYFSSNSSENYGIYTEYLTSVFTQDIDSSASHRIRELELARDSALRNPPLGIGPARVEIASQISVIESFYGYHLIKWGIAGLLFMLAIKLTITRHSISFYKKYKVHESTHEVSAFALAVALITMSEILLFGLSSAITDRLKTLPTYYLFVGYVFMLKAQTNSLRVILKHSQ